jgi:hypothetical protein
MILCLQTLRRDQLYFSLLRSQREALGEIVLQTLRRDQLIPPPSYEDASLQALGFKRSDAIEYRAIKLCRFFLPYVPDWLQSLRRDYASFFLGIRKLITGDG